MIVCNPVLETPEIKYSVQPGCGFLDDGYYRATYNSKTKRGQVHPAIDLNDVRGKDSDLGNRVRAVADGVVVAAGNYTGWGGIVLIHHPQLKVWTQYAHLTGIPVRAGQRVGMGDLVGHIGKGEHDQFWAHLHFEVRVSELPPDFWPSARFPTKAGAEAYIREHYLNPETWLAEHHALRTLAELTQVTAPPSPALQGGPAIPPGWEPLYDASMRRIPGRWLNVVRRGEEFRIVEVPNDKIKKAGLL